LPRFSDVLLKLFVWTLSSIDRVMLKQNNFFFSGCVLELTLQRPQTTILAQWGKYFSIELFLARTLSYRIVKLKIWSGEGYFR
jgi:hypothetical protein